ncbi:pyrimidine 5-nucleotidase [Metschnikowia bicuspidata]|uniref:Pyrimidine 5-nucleotidase n=1 Tax=Metschnikowia bicuspidata TaxID=27322 RepID=A0A4P9ZHW7_9ASCO|nr:pyrimidine 5-nucleotidase [Metschnikowia bicuspidata]
MKKPHPIDPNSLGNATVAHPGLVPDLKYGFGPIPEGVPNHRIFLFDIDNCLYERATQIHDMIEVNIHKYFKNMLDLDDECAQRLQVDYFQTYGLALEGLVRMHQVDAMDYNLKVDDALDLESVLSYNPRLREMLIRVKLLGRFDLFWLATNAYKNHAFRVISILGVADLFDGLTFCDYAQYPIVCKPMPEFFFCLLLALRIDKDDKGALSHLYFVDDSGLNVKAAHDLGFGHVFHYVEMQNEYENLLLLPDFRKYYDNGENREGRKIKVIRQILDLEKIL